MTEEILFEYKKNTKKEGIQALIETLAGIIIVVSGLYLIEYLFPGSKEGMVVLKRIALWFLPAVFVLLLLGYIIPNIRMNRDFSIRITNGHIECIVPKKIYGQSFNIEISNIDTILEDSKPETSSDWYIITKQKEKFELTTNYNNPISKIVDVLREQNPRIIFKREY